MKLILSIIAVMFVHSVSIAECKGAKSFEEMNPIKVPEKFIGEYRVGYLDNYLVVDERGVVFHNTNMKEGECVSQRMSALGNKLILKYVTKEIIEYKGPNQIVTDTSIFKLRRKNGKYQFKWTGRHTLYHGGGWRLMHLMSMGFPETQLYGGAWRDLEKL